MDSLTVEDIYDEITRLYMITQEQKMYGKEFKDFESKHIYPLKMKAKELRKKLKRKQILENKKDSIKREERQSSKTSRKGV